MTKSLLYLHFRKHKCQNFFRMEQDEVQEAKQPETTVQEPEAKEEEPQAKVEQPEAKVEEPKQHEVLVTGGKL